jgi:hypothetical protein
MWRWAGVNDPESGDSAEGTLSHPAVETIHIETTASLMVGQKKTFDVPNRSQTSSPIYLTAFAFSKSRYFK